ncbi:transposase [Neorhizobium galegae]|uniref:IS66 family insertion sequence element accessory protein TnpB n=1 Tax=Neorhizobium galegae TaxID=399 RepID=UPI001AE997F4|nr:IS66 family insertion sequence element accessory protein TnpB [Neorhizobium galegae]MBP2549685.1 transposase [Neorhizobium galegae]
MIAFPTGAKVWIAGGLMDMRCGINSLALNVQQGLGRDPHSGEVFSFRGRKGDLIEVPWQDGVVISLYLKRLKAGRLIGSVSQSGFAVPVRRLNPVLIQPRAEFSLAWTHLSMTWTQG